MAGKSETICVIDGDEIAFVIAAACEERTVDVRNKVSDETISFKHRTSLKNFTKGLEVPENFFEVTDVQTPDKIENALHSVKVTVANIKKACNADKVEVYLSGEGNFRDELPLPSKYKSNREGMIKPLLLTEIRQYLVTKYKAKTVDSAEVDDRLVQRMWDGYTSKQKIIGVTADKDAMGNMGWLYNPNKMSEPEFITGLGELWLDDKGKVRGKGRIWLYLQWVLGDLIDGYNPCEICGKSYGEKSAYKLLKDLKTDKECAQAVYDQYKVWYPGEVKYTDWRGDEVVTDVLGVMQMYLDCARMRRWEGDTVSVKDMLTKLEVVYE